jgi:non-specific serine/threonine protein kinase
MGHLTEDLFDLSRLERFVGPAVYERGRIYYAQRRVEVDFVEPDYASCTVVGRDDVYNVLIKAERTGLIFHCDCPYAETGQTCKHSVASFMAVRDYLRRHKPARWQTQLSRVIQALPGGGSSSSSPYLLFFSLQNTAPPGGYPSWDLFPYHIPLNRLPPDVRAALHGGASAAELVLEDANLARHMALPVAMLDPSACMNSPAQVVTIANLLIEQARVYSSRLAPLASALSLMANFPALLFRGTRAQPMEKPIEIHADPGRIYLELSQAEEGVQLTAGMNLDERTIPLRQGQVHLLSSAPAWVLSDCCVFPLEGEAAASLFNNLLNAPVLLIPQTEQAEFLQDYFLPLAENADLRGDAVTWQRIQGDPVRRLYLSDMKGSLQAELRFGYGDHEVPFDLKLPSESLVNRPGTWTLARITRQPFVEQAAFESLAASQFGMKKAPSPALPGTLHLRSKIHPIDFLMKHVPTLLAAGYEIYGEDRLKSARVNRARPTLAFQVSSGIDWFDVQAAVSFGDVEVAFKDIRRAMQKRERYIKLADGSLGEIPQEWIERYRHLFVLGQDGKNGDLRFTNQQITLVDQLLTEEDWEHADAEFRARSERLRSFNGVESKPLPAGFCGELRPYQKTGFDWLHFLHDYNLGGCLADDMGLGKTVQVLTFLLSLRETKHPTKPDLIVLPRSLLVNWQREAARFTPDLKILEYHGAGRERDLTIFDQYDLVVTTYGIMMRDLHVLRGYRFHYVVLDESQAIKNPAAQTSRAARQMQSDHRLVMTGTPVENSTSELWSQFAFINPGMLGSIDYFREEFANPIERKGDAGQAQLLRRIVFPFILRRSKAQVAPELPPRTERIIYTDMESGQRKMYNRTRDYYRGLLMGLLDDGKQMEDVRFKILEGLLRLRQICNHPMLIDRDFHGESGKFELLVETLETLRSEGHKVLVFSQFVEMLKLLRRELDRRHMPYLYLDGRTVDRQERVDQFQEDTSIPFFLISLKAGGVGLNLTAADYVIHIDPWWNPAVEMQAADRTHRIGQDKPVFIYKLIVRESVEEKILQLQERKKDLVDQLISTDAGFLKSLTSDDVRVLFT